MRPVIARRNGALGAVVLAVSLVVLAGCGGSSGKPAPTKTSSAAAADPKCPQAPTAVSDQIGQRAKIDIPTTPPSDKLDVTVKTQGTGKKVATGDMVVINFTGKLLRGGCYLGSSYDASSTAPPQPVSFVSGQQGQVLPGWDAAVQGQAAGSRIEAVIPPAQGFGPSGRPSDASYPITITSTDTLIFVLDIVGVYSSPTTDIPAGPGLLSDPTLPSVSNAVGAGDPKVTIPKGQTAPTSLVAKTVIQGSGPAVKSGQTLVVQYEGLIWRDGSIFDSSWSKGKNPFATFIGVGAVVKGWDTGLVGQKVGSRVLLVIPPALGYGSSGQTQAGIKGDDTMVFVVDILDAL